MKRISKRTALLCTASAAIALAGCQKLYTNRTRDVSIIPGLSTVATKGLIMTTGNINFTGKTFAMQGYLDDDIAAATGENVLPADKANFHFLNETVNYTGDNSTHSWDWSSVPVSGTDEEKDAARPKWRINIASRFWSYYPVDMASIVTDFALPPEPSPTDAQQKVVTFSYTLPDPAASAPFNDAVNQRDLLFAFNEKEFVKGASQQLDILFYHALAAVNFDITNMSASNDFGSEITLSNVKYSGDCKVTGKPPVNPSDKSVGYEWTNLSSDTRSFSQSFSRAEDFETLGTAPNQYVRQKTSGDKTFFMIPQKLTADTKVTVAFIFKGGSIPITREVPIGKLNESDPDFMSWEAGKIYTYSIKIGGGDDFSLLDVSLGVKDWVDGKQESSF